MRLAALKSAPATPLALSAEPLSPAQTGSTAPPKRWLTRLGPLVVAIAILSALATFTIFSGFGPLAPTNQVVQGLFILDAGIILLLLALVVSEAFFLWRQWRAQAAGASLQLRIVGSFSVIAALPAIVMAIVGTVTVERSLNPAYMQDVRGFVLNTVEAARLFHLSECSNLLREARLTAADLDRGRNVYNSDKTLFRDYFASRTQYLGFTTAVLMRANGEVLDRGDAADAPSPVTPDPADFEDARKGEPSCLLLEEGRSFVALSSLANFPDTFLYVARPVDAFSVEYPKQAADLVNLFTSFDAHRGSIQLAFAIMYVLLALIMLLSATWFGLAFANRLVAPIRRLIAATDQVASGNLYVQVPILKHEGDLAHLGGTFNKMTSELRLQQNSLVAASHAMDERRAFTEAVLSGVPAAVIGTGAGGLVNVMNPSAQRLAGGDAAIGQPLAQLLPELANVLEEARNSRGRQVQGQAQITRGGRERILNVRVASTGTNENMVVTLDDITDLVTAQRTSAWADVARRIAHEIKNPLTPIQLSAERLKRKYGKVIVEDREIFDQCTDTIVRQVEDIKRMVDEFSSFARMPKPRLEVEDVGECVRQTVFLMRNGNPGITITEHLPTEPIMAKIDRRLISQALTNIIKNASEGLATARENGTLKVTGEIAVHLSASADGFAWIDVLDNGTGFPAENRQRLLEPYMTTRAEGTGLGLPIVAKILEDHGGGIELLDAPSGQGARVAMYFPLHTVTARTDKPAGPATTGHDIAPAHS